MYPINQLLLNVKNNYLYLCLLKDIIYNIPGKNKIKKLLLPDVQPHISS